MIKTSNISLVPPPFLTETRVFKIYYFIMIELGDDIVNLFDFLSFLGFKIETH